MNRIRELRKEKGWKQSELGKLLNVQEAAISKYESEKIPLTNDTLIKLSKIFDVSVDYILLLTNNRKNEELETNNGEKQLLDTYRKLSRTNKNKIIERAETLLEMEQQNISNKDVG